MDGLQGAWHPSAGGPTLAQRIISGSRPLLQDTDARFYRRFLRSLLRQVRHLRHTAADVHRGDARKPRCALLCRFVHRRPGAPHQIGPARLTAIQRQILPDGIISAAIPPHRRPDRAVAAAAGYASRNIAAAGTLNAIDRMMPMLRFFVIRKDVCAFQRHGHNAEASPRSCL
jgi:uncharacterized heparinase superfamily protein